MEEQCNGWLRELWMESTWVIQMVQAMLESSMRCQPYFLRDEKVWQRHRSQLSKVETAAAGQGWRQRFRATAARTTTNIISTTNNNTISTIYSYLSPSPLRTHHNYFQYRHKFLRHSLKQRQHQCILKFHVALQCHMELRKQPLCDCARPITNWIIASLPVVTYNRGEQIVFWWPNILFTLL